MPSAPARLKQIIDSRVMRFSSMQPAAAAVLIYGVLTATTSQANVGHLEFILDAAHNIKIWKPRFAP